MLDKNYRDGVMRHYIGSFYSREMFTVGLYAAFASQFGMHTQQSAVNLILARLAVDKVNQYTVQS